MKYLNLWMEKVDVLKCLLCLKYLRRLGCNLRKNQVLIRANSPVRFNTR